MGESISVIIPSFNRADFLADSIHSVLDQSYANVEVLVVDDGSTDNTRELVSAISTKDQRVRYFYQANAGRSRARNHGLSLAKGDWLIFLDSDDMLANDSLHVVNSMISQNPGVSCVAGETLNIDESGLFIEQSVKKPNNGKYFGLIDQPYSKLIRDFYLPMGSYAVARPVIEQAGGFKPELEPCEDFDFCLRVSLHSTIFRTDKTVALIRRHGGNTSPRRFYSSGLNVAKKHLNRLEIAPFATNMDLIVAEWRHNMADDYYGLGRHSKALTCYIKAAQANPYKLVSFRFLKQIISCLLPVGAKQVSKDFVKWR